MDSHNGWSSFLSTLGEIIIPFSQGKRFSTFWMKTAFSWAFPPNKWNDQHTTHNISEKEFDEKAIKPPLNIDQDGLVIDPGMFEGEPRYVPYLWAICHKDGLDEELNVILKF
jgi:hypothetical protein